MATNVPQAPVGFVKAINLTVQFLKADGQSGTVDGIPVWASADEAIFAVTDVSPDGLSAKARRVGPDTAAGQVVQVTCTADADLGSGVRNVVGMIELTASSEVVTANVVAGTLEDIPATPTP